MKKRFILLLSLFVFFLPATLLAQQDSASRGKEQFKLGVYYNSGLNYYGRTDSLRSTGFFPMAELWFDQHFYINAAPVFVNNAVSHFEYAGTVATAGYMFRNAKWAGNAYLVKPFYQDNSQLVQSALKAQAAASFSKLTKYLDLTFGGDIKYSDKFDFGATAGLSHLFRFQTQDNLVIVINPSVNINAGTQQFTKKSYKYILPGIPQEVTEQVREFNILSYEMLMPMVFAKGKFQLIMIPAYVIPQNLIKITNQPDLSERGREMFYITVGAKVSF
ncbi:MAG: hypothetical protein HZB42_11215 [Sphingobacteriales bacterium]|nr:hypothetical protein [Sphingobacteriales bacterium]